MASDGTTTDMQTLQNSILLLVPTAETNKGEHGYDNEVMDMKAFITAAGTDFHCTVLAGPFKSVNMFHVICHLL